MIDSLKRNQGILLDHETTAILAAESCFSRSFQKFSGRKALSDYVKKKSEYVEPREIKLDPEIYQYVPIHNTLEVVLKHEDMLGEVLNDHSSSDGRISNFCHGTNYKENKLFSVDKNALQIVLYHDDFNVANLSIRFLLSIF